MATSNASGAGNSSILDTGSSFLSGIDNLFGSALNYTAQKVQSAADSINLVKSAQNNAVQQNTPTPTSQTDAVPADPVNAATNAQKPQNQAAAAQTMAAYKPYIIAFGALLVVGLIVAKG